MAKTLNEELMDRLMRVSPRLRGALSRGRFREDRPERGRREHERGEYYHFSESSDPHDHRRFPEHRDYYERRRERSWDERSGWRGHERGEDYYSSGRPDSHDQRRF